MYLLFISCCCLLVRRLVQYKLKYNKIFSWADCKKLEKNSSILLCWWHDCVCLWFVKSLLFCSALPGRDTICQLCERLYSPLSLSLIPLCWLPRSLGPFILDQTMGSAGLSIDQTKQEWQFRMLISVTAAVAALTAMAIWPALQKTVKCTQGGYLSALASRLFLPPCPNLTCWGERSIVQYWRCKLFCTLSTLYILGFVFTYEQWRDLLLDI